MRIMKKSFLIVCALVICALTGYAQQPNIFASGLKLEQVSGNTYKFHYTLNADAQSGSINLIPAQGEPIAFPPPGAEYFTKGAHTATISLETVPAGTYTWSVTATAAANPGTDPVKITDDTDVNLKFGNARGFAVDINPESPGFGRIYVGVGNPGTVATAGRELTRGIYILDAALGDVTNQGNTAWNAAGWNSNTNPIALWIDPQGRVYGSDWSDVHGGIWVMSPTDPTNMVDLFGGTNRASDGAVTDGAGNFIHGSTGFNCVIIGEGADAKLYTIEEDFPGGKGKLVRFDLGTATYPYTGTPTLFGDKYFANYGTMAADGHGGLWVAHSRAIGGEIAANPGLVHFKANGIPDYSSDGALGAVNGGSVAVSPDKQYLAVGGTKTAGNDTKQVAIYQPTFDATGGVTLGEPVLTIPTWNNETQGVAYDLAGNLYVVTGSTSGTDKLLTIFALPKTENTFTTPAPTASKITIESATPPPAIGLTTLLTKTDYAWNTGNASRDAAVYDGKVYAIDNSGKIHVINGATGEEDASALITNTNLQCFSIASDGAGKLYVPSNNTAGSSAFGITTVDLLNANTVTTLTYAGETGTVGDGKRTDFIEAYRVNATTTYIAGPSTNTTPQLRIWSTDGTTVTTPIVSADINYKADATINNNNTGGDITFIDATHLITTGQSNTPKLVTIDPVGGTATAIAISETAGNFGGSSYFVLESVPYLVLADGGLGAIKVYNFTNPAAPVEVASAPAIGSVTNATIHVGIDAFVSGNVATVYVWSPNNGLAVHKLTVGGTDNIPAVAADPAVTIAVKSYELEVKTGGAQLSGYALYGIDGRLVRSGKANGTSASIAIGNLPQGVYVLQVTTSQGVVTRKFMKR
ncbi:hypothetical protein FACS1894182_07690 [Bacteroidia bacterium]|nr:hypothetical protein FACS1894182_07690 [Bacteroidia bacterium]